MLESKNYDVQLGQRHLTYNMMPPHAYKKVLNASTEQHVSNKPCNRQVYGNVTCCLHASAAYIKDLLQPAWDPWGTKTDQVLDVELPETVQSAAQPSSPTGRCA